MHGNVEFVEKPDWGGELDDFGVVLVDRNVDHQVGAALRVDFVLELQQSVDVEAEDLLNFGACPMKKLIFSLPSLAFLKPSETEGSRM